MLESDKCMKRNRLRSGVSWIVSLVVRRVGGLGISGGFSRASFQERVSVMKGSLAMFCSCLFSRFAMRFCVFFVGF